MSVAALAAAVLSPALVHGADDGRAGIDSAPKDYVVFFGLDVFANDDGKMRAVIDGSEREVLVMDERTNAPMPLRNVPLRAEVTPRLSRIGINIEGLTGYPVHSPGTDPVVEAQSQMLTMQNVAAHRQQEAEIRMLQSEGNAQSLAGQLASTDPRSAGYGELKADLEAANQDSAAAMSAAASTYGTPPFRDFTPAAGVVGEGADGLEVAFRIFAPTPRANAYGVLRVILKSQQRPETKAQALKVFRLKEVTPDPRKIVVRIFGLPPGFTVDSYHVHVYAGGQELATNLSPNRVDLTEDEAHQYLILRHAQVHRGGTMPAEVLAEILPTAPRPQLVGGQEATLVSLNITAEGRVEQVGGDATSSTTLSTEIQAALRDVRFLPALLDGKPVASTGSFALGELLQ